MSSSEKVFLSKAKGLKSCKITLPASKSESNRAQIIAALAGGKSKIGNLSEARDTEIMKSILDENPEEWNARDAGTTFRFLTAFAALKESDKVITGTPRMQQRPIRILAEALITLGADIEYLGNEGYPPLRIKKITDQKTDKISIQGNISSQYISALFMIAPLLENGLKIEFTSEVTSLPYLKMTASIMKGFGVEVIWNQNSVEIPAQSYHTASIDIESDWSAASYWYALVALADHAEINLPGLRAESFQGDQEIQNIMASLGVKTEFTQEGARISTSAMASKDLELDFVHCPDLAQTIAVICAAKGVYCKMTGLESLKIKETDRVLALQNELGKINAQLVEQAGYWELIPANHELSWESPIEFDTYEDHRMAMAFAPLALLGDVIIHDPEVVNKSYPGFWKDLAIAGLNAERR